MIYNYYNYYNDNKLINYINKLTIYLNLNY